MHTSISVEELELFGFHGYFEEEQRLGQKFRFGILAELAPVESHFSDNLETSVRYDQLIEEVQRISDQAKFRTLEALAEAIARALFKRFDQITRIAVSASKASPPIPQTVQRIAVKIVLDR